MNTDPFIVLLGAVAFGVGVCLIIVVLGFGDALGGHLALQTLYFLYAVGTVLKRLKRKAEHGIEQNGQGLTCIPCNRKFCGKEPDEA